MDKDTKQKLLKKLGREHACYVLITCDHPQESGEMNVEFSYEGDPALASYLIQGAQSAVDEADEEIFVEDL